MKYRPYIDGLRAIAVLSVIVFHLQKDWLPGGFVGVDIFFVISGFLITGNIVQEIDKGRFSILEFYRRRVKRIAPMMLLIVGLTLVAAYVLMVPEDARTTAKSGVWSLLSMANVYFWLYQDTTYFAANSAETPLLHLWSLGVEEQFYLLWPVLLLAAYRPGLRRAFIIAATAGALASFALASYLFSQAPSFVYYMIPTRAGELLLGAIVAVAVRNGIVNRVPRGFVEVMAAIGFTSLIASLCWLSEREPFPGWLALFPTGGATLLILSGECGEQWFSRLLSLRPLVAVGLVSYSAYLWHWPLLAFYRYGYGSVNLLAGFSIFALTMLLSWGSYRYIEQPARRSNASPLRVFARFYIFPAGAIFAASLLAIYGDRAGIALSSEAYRQHLQQIRRETQPAFLSETVCQRQRILPQDVLDARCVLGADSSTQTAILWGDSNAAHYVGMIEAFARQSSFSFRNVEIGSCPPVFGDPGPFVDARRQADCRTSIEVVRPLLDHYRVVILAASWLTYLKRSDLFLPSFYETARELAQSGKTVIIVGNVPLIQGYDRRCREKQLSFPFVQCPETGVPMSKEITAVNESLRRFAESTPNTSYFDANAYLCPDGQCSAFGADGVPKYFDEGHLTLAASSKLGAEIIAREGVPAPFAAIAHSTR